MSNTVGPVCHIPPVNTPGDPQPKDIPGIPGPANPNDPVSITNLLNAMRLALLALLNELNRLNNADHGFQRKPDPNKDKTQWTEHSRVTNKVRVYQNNDPTSQNWVDVEQINQLVMQDKKTGNLWKWSRNR